MKSTTQPSLSHKLKTKNAALIATSAIYAGDKQMFSVFVSIEHIFFLPVGDGKITIGKQLCQPGYLL